LTDKTKNFSKKIIKEIEDKIKAKEDEVIKSLTISPKDQDLIDKID
jgi:hypothetical protein